MLVTPGGAPGIERVGAGRLLGPRRAQGILTERPSGPAPSEVCPPSGLTAQRRRHHPDGVEPAPLLDPQTKEERTGGGTRASRTESTVITACRGFCCLLFVFLAENSLVRGGEGRAGSRAHLHPRGPEKQARDGVVSPSTRCLQTHPGRQLRTLGPTGKRGARVYTPTHHPCPRRPELCVGF